MVDFFIPMSMVKTGYYQVFNNETMEYEMPILVNIFKDVNGKEVVVPVNN